MRRPLSAGPRRDGVWLGTIPLLLAFVACGQGGAIAGPADGGSFDEDASSPTVPGAGLPCEVSEVLARACGDCHARSPRYGAPMPLTSLADLHAYAQSDPTQRVFELVRERIHSETDPMPPTGELSDAELAILDAFLDGGAAAGGEACGDGDGGIVVDPQPEIGPEHLPCTPTHSFLAHAPDSGTAPFHVAPDAGNAYMCFAFRSPFAAGAQATSWAPIVGDERVLHHWILYETSQPQVEGSVGPCNMPADSTFLMGWAPGGQNWTMPEHVGMELPDQDEWLILQVHYWNVPGYTDALDRSGVALCTTDEPRPQEAGTIWLGSSNIEIPPRVRGYTITGTCPSDATSRLSRPLHVLASFPHMHEYGTAFETTILRQGDPEREESLVKVERFDFNNQLAYRHSPPVMIHPGDALHTRCTYANTTNQVIRRGERTEDEMCFNFIMAYPIDGVGRSCIF